MTSAGTADQAKPHLARLSWRKVLACGAIVAAAFVGLVGFLHTPQGRPLLVFAAGALGESCPLGMSRGTLDPATREALRRKSLIAQAHVPSAAPSRTALGVLLGSMDRAGIAAWAAGHGISCHEESSGAGLACDGVAQDLVAGTGSEQGSMYYRFDASGRLVGVLRMVRVPAADRAAALAAQEQSNLRERFGDPIRVTGRPEAAYLASGPLRQARVEHRFRDFSATSSVTNMGRGEYLWTEEAQVYD